MNENELNYLAGVIDSDGWITIKKSSSHKSRGGRAYLYYQANLGLAQVERQAIDLFCKTFNCNFVIRKPFNPKHRDIYCVTLGAKKAIDTLKILLPYLRIKKKQAEKVIDFDSLCKHNLSKRKVNGQVLEKDKSLDNKYYLDMKELNVVGMRQ